MKKAISGLLALALGTTMLAGCQKKEEQTTGDGGRMTITWVGSSGQAAEKDSDVERYLEERYNVDLEIMSITGNFNEKLGAMIATNTIPDVFFVNEPETWIPLAKQGILAEVKMEWIEELAPNLFKDTNELDEAIWGVCQYEGTNYVLPRFTGGETTVASCWRKDWLDKVGITKIPETIDEFEEAFIKFRNSDPDGNGQKDTYALSGQGNHSARLFDAIFGAYGVMPGQWENNNGVITNGTVSLKAREALERLHSWYAQELIDPEFITDIPQTIVEKYNKGKIGVNFTSADSFINSTAAGRQYLNDWKVRNPEAEFAIGGLPKGPNGDSGSWLWGPRSNFVAFGEQVDEAKIKRVLTMLNDMYSDEEVALRVVWGVKGETYDYNDPAVGEASGLKYLPPYDSDTNARAKLGIGQSGFFSMLQPLATWAAPDVTEKYTPAEIQEIQKKYLLGGKYQDAILRVVLPSATLYSSNLDKLKVVNYSMFITGERDLAEWDNFVSEWMSSGGETLTKEAQEYYDKNLKK